MVDIKFFKPVSATSSGTSGGVGSFPAPVAPGSPVSETLSPIGTGYVSLIQSDGSKEQTLTIDDTATLATPVGAFVSAIFRTTLPTYTDGDGGILHLDNRGRLLVSYGEGGITADVEVDQDPAPAFPAGSFVSMKYEATLPTYAGGDAVTLHAGSRGRLFVTAMDPVSGNTADVGTDDSAGPANPVGTFPMALYRAALPTYTDGDSANLHVEPDGRLKVNQAIVVSNTALRASAILTASFVNSSSVASDTENQLVLLVTATMGSLSSIEIRVQFSDDNATWYQETFGSISGGTDTLSAGEHQITTTGFYRIPIPVMDNFIRIGAKGTGTVTGSSLAIDGILGVT
jgi:hypothetical protein